MMRHQGPTPPVGSASLGWPRCERTTLHTWISMGALCVLLAAPTVAVGQESELQEHFGGVRRDTALPGVLEDILEAFGQELGTPADNTPQAEAAPLQQPGRVRAFGASAGDDGVVVRHKDEDGELLPSPRMEGRVPISGWNAAGDVDIVQEKNGNVSMVVRDAPLSRVLSLLAQTYGLNIVASNDIDAIISITLSDVPLERALTAILSVANYTWVDREGIILITSLLNSGQLPADVQGRRIEVFDLDFASASVIGDAVTGLLSPIGSLTITESDEGDNRRTREMIVVEDLPDSIARIAAYIHRVDQPPRQVLLEAHILEVALNDTDRHGVNFDALLRANGSTITLETTGFANPAASPAFLATVEGGDLEMLVELLQTTTDTKTLGSPKLLVLNRQRARIHVGETIGFQTTVTTELQSTGAPQSLDVGVTLLAIPQITRDGRVLLHVEPEVSTGEFNPVSQAPDTQTTELVTDVMLDDGQGMVIGGLIKELDKTTQSKIPYLGDIWHIGNVFKRSEVTKDRVEVIIAITPRIQPYDPVWQEFEQGELVRSQTTLFGKDLCRHDRPWDPLLHDGKRKARPLVPVLPPKPELDPYCECITPTPPYHVPARPPVVQRFGYEKVDPWNAPPPQILHAEPGVASEFAGEFAGEFLPEGTTTITDQP